MSKHWERKGRKKERKKKLGKRGSIERQACTNRLISFLPLKPYSLSKRKRILIKDKPFKLIPSKQLISFPWEISRIEKVVHLLGFNSAALLGVADWFFSLWFDNPTIIILHLFLYFWPTRCLLSPPFIHFVYYFLYYLYYICLP